MKKIILIVLCFFLGYIRVEAQALTEFSKNHPDFISQLKSLLTREKSNEGEEVIKEFEKFWNSPNFQLAQKDSFISYSSLLLLRKASPVPHLSNYCRLAMVLASKSGGANGVEVIERALGDFLRSKEMSLNEIADYLQFNLNLLNGNILNKINTLVWRLSAPNYQIRYEKKRFWLEVSNVDLQCSANSDSARIVGTHGQYFPFAKLWVGNSGTLGWMRAGLGNEAQASLNNYRINTSDYAFKADSVKFMLKGFLREPLIGRLEEKVLAPVSPSNAVFPKFYSREKRLVFNNVYPDVDYEGDFQIKGPKIFGSGTSDRKAQVTIHHGDTIQMWAKANTFILDAEHLQSDSSEVKICMGKDSIYHRSLIFKYFKKDQEVVMVRVDKNLKDALILNSLLKQSVDADVVRWKITTKNIGFSGMPDAPESKIKMKSLDFFNEDDFQSMGLGYTRHPLVVLRNWSDSIPNYDPPEKYGKTQPNVAKKKKKPLKKRLDFTTQELARDMRVYFDNVHAMLVKLSYNGFVDYDIKNKTGRIKPYLFDYFELMKNHDDISIESSVFRGSENGVFKIDSALMSVAGVDSVHLQTKQLKNQKAPAHIYFKPDNKKISMKKNRDMAYDGSFKLGSFIFYGKNFYFDYANFKMNLDNCDSLKIEVSELNPKDSTIVPTGKTVLHSIRDITGYAFLDTVINRSGKMQTPEYPKFVSKGYSYVYYNDSSIQEIAYPKERFNFKIDPYKIDKIFLFTTKNWKLKGTFYSGNIIPDLSDSISIIKEDLTTSIKGRKEVDEYSFGLQRKTNDDGILAYGGKGRFFNTVRLSAKGLRGNGKLTFLKSTSLSDDFKFYMDSLKTRATQFDLKTQDVPVEYASTSGKFTNITWIPEVEKMTIATTLAPFRMYDKGEFVNDSIKMKGKIVLESTGLTGDGTVNISNGIVKSKEFTFKATTFNAEHSDFELRTLNLMGSAFDTKNVKSKFDLTKRTGQFNPYGKNNAARFPLNDYMCYMDEYFWDMKLNNIVMTTKEDPNKAPVDTTGMTPAAKELALLDGAKYISTRKGQDSLTFNSNYAFFTLEKHILTAKNVKLINVADATIYPSAPIVIGDNAVIESLDNARILANRDSRFHEIHNATVIIEGRKSYTGTGTYYYVDETKETQKIIMSSIKIDSIGTVAKGRISEKDAFRLGTKFSFFGDVVLQAKYKDMMFEGYTSIKHECKKLPIQKIKFKSRINPDSIMISLPEKIVNQENTELFASVFMTNDSSNVYSAFLSPRSRYSDIPIFSAKGTLYYDKASRYYMLGNKEKILDANQTGNLIKLHEEFCFIKGEGDINTGINYGPVKMQMLGNVSHELATNGLELDMLMAMDFFFDKKALDDMSTTLKSAQLKGFEISDDKFKRHLNQFIGVPAATKLIETVMLEGEFKITDKMKHTLVLYNVKMNWNPESSSYQSAGQIGIGTIDNVVINRMVDGIVEIVKRRSGDIVNVYFELSQDKWYYFKYFVLDRVGTMTALSSTGDFNTIIKNLKSKSRKISNYEFSLGPDDDRNKFLQQFTASREEAIEKRMGEKKTEEGDQNKKVFDEDNKNQEGTEKSDDKQNREEKKKDEPKKEDKKEEEKKKLFDDN